MSESPFEWLQRFFQSLCNGDWEHDHTYGVRLETMSDPGWLFKFNLIGTPYEDIELEELSEDAAPISWLKCKMQEGEYIAMCSPRRLAECIDILRDIVEGRRGVRPPVPDSDASCASG